MKLHAIAVTAGEPAGIGADICLSLPALHEGFYPVVLGDIHVLRERAERLHCTRPIAAWHGTAPSADSHPETLWVQHSPCPAPVLPGTLNAANSPYVLRLLDDACAGIGAGRFAAMVTAPVHKGIINDAGVPFSGHTEYLAQKAGCTQVVMMLAGGGLRVALATTHLPLKDVAAALTPALLHQVLRILIDDLQHKFGLARPRIKVAGLNPHAGEGGHIGSEDETVIRPVIHAFAAQGHAVSGPYPADTLFQPFMLEDCDAVLAMYHDQGLPVLKYASFGRGVNITLGLPFIRTSVDHGTALDLAASGRADSGSLKEAFAAAVAMARAQRPSL